LTRHKDRKDPERREALIKIGKYAAYTAPASVGLFVAIRPDFLALPQCLFCRFLHIQARNQEYVGNRDAQVAQDGYGRDRYEGRNQAVLDRRGPRPIERQRPAKPQQRARPGNMMPTERSRNLPTRHRTPPWVQ